MPHPGEGPHRRLVVEAAQLLDRLNFLLGEKQKTQLSDLEARINAEIAKTTPGAVQVPATPSAASRARLGRRYGADNQTDINMALRLFTEVAKEIRSRALAQGLPPPSLEDSELVVARTILDPERALGEFALVNDDPLTQLINDVIGQKERLELAPHPEVPIFGMQYAAYRDASFAVGDITQRQFDLLGPNPDRQLAPPTPDEVIAGATFSQLEADAFRWADQAKAALRETGADGLLVKAAAQRGDFAAAATAVFNNETPEDVAQGRSVRAVFGKTQEELSREIQQGDLRDLIESGKFAKAAEALSFGFQQDPLDPNKDFTEGKKRANNALALSLENLAKSGRFSTEAIIASGQASVGEGGQFERDFIAATGNIQRDEQVAGALTDAPDTVGGFSLLVKEALARHSVFNPSSDSLNRLGLQLSRLSGISSAEDVPSDIIIQGINDARIEEERDRLEEAQKTSGRLTASDQQLDAFVLAKLRDEGVFSRSSSPEFIQNIFENIVPDVAADVATALDENPFASPDVVFDTAFASLTERPGATPPTTSQAPEQFIGGPDDFFQPLPITTPGELGGEPSGAATFGLGLSEFDFNRQRGIGGVTLPPGGAPIPPVSVFGPSPEQSPFLDVPEAQSAFDALSGSAAFRQFAESRFDILNTQFLEERRGLTEAAQGTSTADTEGLFEAFQQIQGANPAFAAFTPAAGSFATPLPDPLAFGDFLPTQQKSLETAFAKTAAGETERRRILRRPGRNIFTPIGVGA